jgi:arylsulfatase A-like enzyme
MLRLVLPAALMLVSAAFAAQPNIVFVLVDDMGYGDLGCMGSPDIKTPHIDRIAKEGVKFTDFYANAPVCTPTRCAFITGRWQQRVGFEFAMGYTAEQVRKVDGKWVNEPDIHSLGLPTTQPSIAKFLKGAGYATGAFGKWHLGYKDEFNPVHHGFDEYFGTLLGHSDYYTRLYMDGTNCLRDGLKPVTVDGYTTDLLNQHAVAFIKKHAKEPFFLYLPHQAVHAPFQPPGKHLEKITADAMHEGSRVGYKDMLEKVDEGVGMIFAELEKAGIADNTLLVLSSDNGGERWSDNRPLFHHKATVWEGGIRVPLLMRWPAKLPKDVTTKQVGITMDLTATFTAVAQAKTPADYQPDGINLIPLLTGEKPEQERTLFWRIDRSNRKQWAVRSGKWKYVNDGNTMDLLFDLDADIGEHHDLNYEHPEIVHELKAKLKAWQTEMDASDREFIVR